MRSKLSTVRQRATTLAWRARRRPSRTLVSVVPWRSSDWPRELTVAIATDDHAGQSRLRRAFVDHTQQSTLPRVFPQLDQLPALGPDAIVIDSSLPFTDQLVLTDELARLPGAPAVIVLRSAETDVDRAVATLHAGASALLPREATASQLRAAVECVLRGEAVVPPEVAAHVVRTLQAADRR